MLRVDSTHYRRAIQTFIYHISWKRLELRGKWLLHQDNAGPHTSKATTAFLRKKGIEMIPHPAYSPDLAPCDFWLFPNLKASLRRQKFNRDEDVVIVCQTFFNLLKPANFAKTWVKWCARWDQYIHSEGHYLEKERDFK